MTGAVGGTPPHPGGIGLFGPGVSSRTLGTPVQPTCSWGWRGWSGARRGSAGRGGSGWRGGGGRMPTRSWGGSGRAGAGASGSATT